jgi:hypothetical protein
MLSKRDMYRQYDLPLSEFFFAGLKDRWQITKSSRCDLFALLAALIIFSKCKFWDWILVRRVSKSRKKR